MLSSFMRFVVVGGGAALSELSIFYVLNAIPLTLISCNVVSFLVGMTVSFLGYRYWSFDGDHKFAVTRQVVAYCMLATVNMFASSAILHLLVNIGAQPLLGKVLVMSMVAVWNFFILRRFIFRVK